MAARERGPERRGVGVEGRTQATDEILGAEHGQLHADQDGEQEEERPAISIANRIDDHEHDGEADDDPDVAEISDGEQAACRGRGGAVIVPPRGDGVVDVLDGCDAADEDGENSEHEAAH